MVEIDEFAELFIADGFDHPPSLILVRLLGRG
jgi:hypothetical protein